MMMIRSLVMTALLAVASQAALAPGQQPHAANPVLPGYYADPSVAQFEGKFYVYATLDPWGDETLGCWESSDFKHWTYRVLNWPTKKACTSPTSGGSAVWAPSVVRGADGKFHMYISVGNEVWTGVADHPLGPWRDANGGKPLVPREYRPGFHMIDAEGFVDDDGTGWLYWGSGHGWKNGKCWVVKLKPDMVTFDGEVRDVTPTNYFEGPVMVKRGGRYFLMYSQGVTIKDTYQVHYAVGDNPLGPFTEAANSPILVTDREKNVISPGHHTVFAHGGKDYILYHRHSIPFDPKFVGRQTCVDELKFTADGLIEKVVPTHEGPALVQGRDAGRNRLTGAVPNAVFDDNYATTWRGETLQTDLGSAKAIKRQELRLEYAWKPYRFVVQASDDGATWRDVTDFRAQPATGSPVLIETPVTARYLRIQFDVKPNDPEAGVIEWEILP
jgi:beta-xylosidase